VQEFNESAKFEHYTNNLTLCGKANKNKEIHVTGNLKNN